MTEHEPDDLWLAPTRLDDPIDATVTVPGSKSITNRALVLAALADGPGTIRRPLYARDTELMIAGLRALGADITGDAVPFTVHGTGALPGGSVTIDASSSSQFVSALLLAGARFDEGVTVVHDGPPVPSQPHIAMTVSMLREVGVEVDDSQPERWAVAPGPIAARDLEVEPDLSNAAPFIAAAMVTGGTVVIPGWPMRTTQPGDALRFLFAEMGGSCTLGTEGLTARGPDALLGIDVDLHEVGELTPVIAAVCALATTPSTLRGIAHLRLHETDRLAALARELNALGANVIELEDGLRIDPAPLHGGVFHTYDDHRLATAGAVLGLVVPGVYVENVETTAKTMPEFVDLWLSMLEGR